MDTSDRRKKLTHRWLIGVLGVRSGWAQSVVRRSGRLPAWCARSWRRHLYGRAWCAVV